MTTTTTRTAPEITVTPAPGIPGKACVRIGDTDYLFTDCTSFVRVQKFLIHGGEEYVVRIGSRGCYGCGCKDALYRRRICKHAKAADLFLDATW